MRKKIVLVDLDGVLNQYHGNYDKDVLSPIKNGAEEFLKNLAEDFTVKIFTVRDLALVQKWVEDNNLTEYISDLTNVKEPAFLIIDDRCVKFDGNFEQTLNDVKTFAPYWKNE